MSDLLVPDAPMRLRGHFAFRAYRGEVRHRPLWISDGGYGRESLVRPFDDHSAVLVVELPPERLKVWEWEGDNLVVTSGKDLSLDRLFALSGPPAAIGNVGVGTDSTAAAAGQTQLNPSVSGSVLLQTADAGTARSAETVTIASTYGTGVANFNWNEFGLFNGNTNGTSKMLNRIVIGAYNKTSVVSIVITGTITQG